MTEYLAIEKMGLKVILNVAFYPKNFQLKNKNIIGDLILLFLHNRVETNK